MAIAFVCGGCGKKFTVKDELAGKKGKCQGCGAPIVIPSASADDDYDVEPIVPAAAPTPAKPAPAPLPTILLDDEARQAGGPTIGQAPEPAGFNPGFPQRVVVVNFDMKFLTLVNFLVKLAIAAIPAAIILWVFSFAVMLAFFTILSALGFLGAGAVNAVAPRPAPPAIERRAPVNPFRVPPKADDEAKVEPGPPAVQKKR